MCVFECASVLGYMADIRLYPSFHQLSEEESSSDTLQSDPDVHVRAHTCTLIHTVAEKQSYFNAGHHSSAQNLNAAFH